MLANAVREVINKRDPMNQHYYAMVIKATILKPELLNRCVNQWTLFVDRSGRAGSAGLTK